MNRRDDICGCGKFTWDCRGTGVIHSQARFACTKSSPSSLASRLRSSLFPLCHRSPEGLRCSMPRLRARGVLPARSGSEAPRRPERRNALIRAACADRRKSSRSRGRFRSRKSSRVCATNARTVPTRPIVRRGAEPARMHPPISSLILRRTASTRRRTETLRSRGRVRVTANGRSVVRSEGDNENHDDGTN